jgi:HSP20 family molecular chaperone IbpA
MKIIYLFIYFITSQAHAMDPFERIFDDMEKSMKEMIKRFDNSNGISGGGFSASQSGFDLTCNIVSDGKELVITPDGDYFSSKGEHNLEIKVNGGALTISGTFEEKTQSGNFTSSSYRSISTQLPIPKECIEDSCHSKTYKLKNREVNSVKSFVLFYAKKGEQKNCKVTENSTPSNKSNLEDTIPLYNPGDLDESI